MQEIDAGHVQSVLFDSERGACVVVSELSDAKLDEATVKEIIWMLAL